MNQSPIVAVFADLHILSTVGLMPPSFKTTHGLVINQSPIQKWLWSCYDDACSQLVDIAGDHPFDIVFNGDVFEGRHHRSTEVATLDSTDDVPAGIEVVGPIAKRANRKFMVRGTECHVGNKELSLAAALGFYENPESGDPIFDRLPIDLNGVRHLFRHHISTAMRPYLEASALSVHLAEEQLEAARNYEVVPRVVVGAHRHRHGMYSNGTEMMIACPPWQALTRHGHKVVSASRCKPGFFILDPRGKRPGELPEVHSFIYQAPPEKGICLDGVPITNQPPPCHKSSKPSETGRSSIFSPPPSENSPVDSSG
jgi:hypothetical protein